MAPDAVHGPPDFVSPFAVVVVVLVQLFVMVRIALLEYRLHGLLLYSPRTGFLCRLLGLACVRLL
jgi:hypothetical protein